MSLFEMDWKLRRWSLPEGGVWRPAGGCLGRTTTSHWTSSHRRASLVLFINILLQFLTIEEEYDPVQRLTIQVFGSLVYCNPPAVFKRTITFFLLRNCQPYLIRPTIDLENIACSLCTRPSALSCILIVTLGLAYRRNAGHHVFTHVTRFCRRQHSKDDKRPFSRAKEEIFIISAAQR